MPVKGLAQQGTLALHTARALLVKQQTMLANSVRSLAAEFGLIAPLGFGKLSELMAQVEAQASVPEAARAAMRSLYGQFLTAREVAASLETSIVAHARHNETARRLATIPGIGRGSSASAAPEITASRQPATPALRSRPRSSTSACSGVRGTSRPFNPLRGLSLRGVASDG